MCKDNTHAAPVGNAQPVAYTSVQIAMNTGDTTCGTGYKDKANKASIVGSTVALCCDAKTCADLTCSYGYTPKASPTQPAAGAEPTNAGCCEAITGKCTGNAASSSDIACPTGYKDKANKASITGTTLAECCDQKTCADHTCAAGSQKKSSPTEPAAGAEPTEAGCCEPICASATCRLCSGNSGGTGNVACPTGFTNKGSGFNYNPALDNPAAQKSKCCMQPKCVAEVNAVSGSCSVNPISYVRGTCRSGYTEKANIASLPADPADWANPGTGIAITDNMAQCCDAITGKCSGNAASANNVACTTGYKDKANKASITGTTVAACCDQKTCADLTCSAGYVMKASPTQPATGAEPTNAGCCEAVTGKCAGNAAAGENVACTTGYKDKANKASITGNTLTACCDQKTCADLTCSTGYTKKASPTEPAAGAEPTNAGCCEAITGKCAGNQVSSQDVTCGAGLKDKPNKASITGTTTAACCDADVGKCSAHTVAGTPYSCPANKVAVELATVSTVACVAAVDCANNAFDVAGVTPVIGYGPVCPDPAAQTAAENACTTASPSPGTPGGGSGSASPAAPAAQTSFGILVLAGFVAASFAGRP